MLRATKKGTPEPSGTRPAEGNGRMVKPQDTKGEGQSSGEVTRDLASRIASAQRSRMTGANRASGDGPADKTSLARGMRIGTEFMAAIVIGGILGYLIDLGLNTSPWGLLIMFMVGFAAGILNVTRAVADMNAASPPPPAPKGPDAEDDKRNEH